MSRLGRYLGSAWWQRWPGKSCTLDLSRLSPLSRLLTFVVALSRLGALLGLVSVLVLAALYTRHSTYHDRQPADPVSAVW